MTNDARYFDSRAAIAAGSETSFGNRGFRTPLLSQEELKAIRSEAERDGCLYRKGPTGSTVFNFRGGYRGQ